MKICRKCSVNKEIENYYKHPQMGDGHLNICIECVKRRTKEWYEKNEEQIRVKEKIRNAKPERRKHLSKNAKEWRIKNPVAYKAQTAVGNALRDGKIFKRPCRFCGTKENIHAHHKDYVNFLDVIWLCAKCHHRMHHDIPKTEGENKKN